MSPLALVDPGPTTGAGWTCWPGPNVLMPRPVGLPSGPRPRPRPPAYGLPGPAEARSTGAWVDGDQRAGLPRPAVVGWRGEPDAEALADGTNDGAPAERGERGVVVNPNEGERECDGV